VERSLQDAKSESGMSDYQVRKYNGRYHHMALVIHAPAFIVKERIENKADVPLLSCRDVRILIIAFSKVLKNTEELINYDLTEHKTCYKKKIGGGRPGTDSIYKNHIQITYESSWQRNQTAIDQQAPADGTFPLINQYG